MNQEDVSLLANDKTACWDVGTVYDGKRTQGVYNPKKTCILLFVYKGKISDLFKTPPHVLYIQR